MPELQQGFEIFFNWQTMIFCLCTYLVTQFVRSIVENAPNAKAFASGWLWKTVLLPSGPVATGIGLALLCKKFPFPMPVADVLSVKVMYGAACGMGCGWLYARVRDWFGVAADSGSPVAQKIATTVLNRPPSIRPPSPPSVPPTATP